MDRNGILLVMTRRLSYMNLLILRDMFLILFSLEKMLHIVLTMVFFIVTMLLCIPQWG